MSSRVKTHLVIIDLPRQLCRGTGAAAVAGHIDQVPNMVTGDGTLESKATPQVHLKPQKIQAKGPKFRQGFIKYH